MSKTHQLKLPPGPRLTPPLQTLGWITRAGPFLERCHRRYGDMFTLRIQNESPWVVLCRPDQIKTAFTGDPNALCAGEANMVLRPIVGRQSVAVLDGPAHMAQRRLMLPPFHGDQVRHYADLMAAVTSRDIATWPVETPFGLWPHMQKITLEIIIRAVFGISDVDRLDHMRDLLRDTINWVTDPFRLGLAAVIGIARSERLPVLRRRLAAVDEVLFDEVRRRRRQSDLDDRDDILSLLLRARYENGAAMTDAELRDELMTLLVVGHETTAGALAWAFERLLRHPEALARLRTALRHPPSRRGDQAGPRPAGEDLQHDDAYLDAVIKETLRLRPVLPIVVRVLKEPTEFGDYVLPAGVAVAPCIYLVHRRADIYPQPRSFRPERFLARSQGAYAWIPFGGGVRRCLGSSFALMEMAVVIKTVLQTIDLAPADARPERPVRRAIALVPNRRTQVVVAR